MFRSAHAFLKLINELEYAIRLYGFDFEVSSFD